MVIVRKATEKDISNLSKKFLQYIEDKESKIYQENVAKFDIPEEYVRKALAEDTLTKAVASGEAVFYVALEGDEIVGFAQTIRKNAHIAELDRIVVFPPYEKKGIGTKLLQHVVTDEQKIGTKIMTVNAGKDETQARKFYEKNGFKLTREMTIDTPWGKKIELVVYELRLTS